MLNGIHWANRDTQPGDTARFMLGKFDAVKLLATQATQHVGEVGEIRDILPTCTFVVRLWDSLWRDPTDPGNDAKARYPGDDELALHWFNQITLYYRLGVRLFQCDCEPNRLWLRAGYGPDNYAAYMKIVIRRLRARLRAAGMTDVKLIAPPLSWDPGMWRLDPTRKINPSEFVLDDWRYAYWWHDANTPSLWSVFDYASAHPYWQFDRQMFDPSYGACFEEVHADSGGMDVWCLEYGCSLWYQEHPPDLQTVYRAQQLQYPAWIEWAEQFEYLKGSMLFINGGSWSGFNLQPSTAVAIGKAYARVQRQRAAG